MTFLNEVRRKRQKLADVLTDEEYSGIRAFVEDLYPDRAHFIYELLQNAEDAGATRAEFDLRSDLLRFEHDGRPFSEDDVWNITNIGKSQKKSQQDKIGRFGIGFKAVFAYSETPRIWSPTYCFEIGQLVLPTELASDGELKERTRFDFPFNNPKKSRQSAHGEVKSGLNELAETTLLFLTNLKSIRWKIGDKVSGEVRRIEHSANHIEVTKEVAGRVKVRSHFLRFDRAVKGLERQHISVAFPLENNQKKGAVTKLRIVPAESGSVAVYFPAKKEVSGLRFHLHAPFVPELSRASIKDSPANEPLYRQLGELTAASLIDIRNLGLLNVEFLSVLPNAGDKLPERYEYIRTAVVDAMNKQPLTPTQGGSHSPATHLLKARAAIKKLLPDKDLRSLVNDKKRKQWAAGAPQKNSDADRFLEGLAIQKWDVEEFVDLLSDKLSRWAADDDFIKWISKKPIEWHQDLYALLQKEMDANEDLTTLDWCKAVRLSDGSYSVGSECFFPSDGIEHDEVLPRVARGTYTSGNNKAQQTNARKFLERLGVRDVAEADEVEAILKSRYSEDDGTFPDDKTYRKDLKRFIALVEKDPDSAGLFADHFVLQCKDFWRKPRELYLDEPFVESGLGEYYKAIGKSADRAAMMPEYKDYGIPVKRLVKFAEAVGVQVKLEIEEQSTASHSMSEELRSDYRAANVKRSSAAIDEDWDIPNLEKALRRQTLELSQTVWKTAEGLESRQLEARFRPNAQFKIKNAPSSIVLTLKKKRWIPQKNGTFVKPSDASRDLLPKGFAFDAGWEWLKAIGFEENVAGKSDERREKQAAARKLGFSGIEALERAQRFATFPRDMQDRILADLEDETSTEGGDGKSKRSKVSQGSGGEADQRSDKTKHSKKQRGAKRQKQSFISYVAASPDAEEPDPDGLDHKTRMSLEARAIEIILEKYPKLRRTPTNNPGFDLFEEDRKGNRVLWVEVKAMTGCLRDRPVGMSHTQFNCARKYGNAYWLYVVEYAGDAKNSRIVRIQDPAGKAKTYTFDCGWVDVAIIQDV